MPDFYAIISDVPQDVQERLAGVLEMRAADAQQREMLKSYLSGIEFPENAQVLEIGCGTGAVTRTLAQWPRVAKAVGVDPSASFVAKAESLSTAIANASFKLANGKSLPFDAGSFDVVVVHTTLCHVPEPEKLLSEAERVRGADVLHQAGRIGKETADALKAEARRRSEAKAWFGHIAFASVLARKAA